MEQKEIIFAPCDNFELNGNIDNYKNATPIYLSETVLGGKPKLATVLYALTSSTHLYFAFDCEDNYVVANMTKYNDKLYNEDVCEVFIGIDGNRGKYIELEISPKGVIFCGLIYNNLKKSRKLKLYNRAIAQGKATKTKKGYMVEFKMSLQEIKGKLNTRNAEKLVGNAYRIDRHKEGGWELSAVNPTKKEAFHIPEKFIPFII